MSEAQDADGGPSEAYRVIIRNAWGQRQNIIAATLEVAQAWADKRVEELVWINDDVDAPDYDGWSKSVVGEMWSPDGDTEDWEITIREYDLKTESPKQEVEA